MNVSVEKNHSDRRPIRARSSGWAQAGARALIGWGVGANAISCVSVVFATVGCALFCVSGQIDGGWAGALVLVGAGVCIQGRLICNLLDGMVAIESGRQSPLGNLYNEIPDRVADTLFLAGAGYACAGYAHGAELGWACAALAAVTAYLRVLGKSMGTTMIYAGPMAKQHRMAALTAGALGGAIASAWGLSGAVMYGVVIVIASGTLVTCIRRTVLVARAVSKEGGAA